MNILLSRDPQSPLPFSEITPEVVESATVQLQEAMQDKKNTLVQTQLDPETFVRSRDGMFEFFDRVVSPIYLLKETSESADLRTACQKAVETLFRFYNELRLDEGLYKATAAQEDRLDELNGAEARYLVKAMDDYRRNGFQLGPEERDKLKALDNALSEKELEFQKNISEASPFSLLSEADLDGMPEDFVAQRRQEDGRIKITTQYPDYFPVMKFAKSESVRKDLYKLYLTRASEANVGLLKQIIELRNQRTALLGFDTFAGLALKDKMAQESETVWSFLQELSDKVREKAVSDYDLLKGFGDVEQVKPWDKFYLTSRLKEEQYQLDEAEVKQFFPLEKVLEGLFNLAQSLYQVSFEDGAHLPVWQKDVRAYEVTENGQVIGRFYLDLFPRENKYGHAACFGLQTGCGQDDSYQPPYAALVCNFTPPASGKPSLLTHDEVQTLFHEFGHLMHQLLTRSPLAAFAGTNVARDFVEMPSQIMENWVWEPDALQTISGHYESGEPLPDALIEKMLAVRHLNSGIDIQQQVFYASLDMTYHDGYSPSNPEDLTRVLYDLQRKHTLFQPLDGTCMQASFGHLIGYSAAYYGYLWSRVYADDMYSVFKEKGLFSADAGRAFRDIVLAEGDCREPMDLIKDFLGRPPQMDAFLANIGVQA